MTFGQKLKEARTTKKLTQKQLADAVGAKHNSVSDWENDKNKPDPDTIELLCGVLDITPNYLLNSNSNDFSLAEKEIIKKYRKLDAHGKKMVDFTLKEEWERSVHYTQNAVIPLMVAEETNYNKINAAHEKENISYKAKQSEEQKIQEKYQEEISKRKAMMSDKES